MLPIHTILYPTDFSPGAEAAFRLAEALARDGSAELVVLHVAEPAIMAFGEGVVPPVPDDYLEQLRHKLGQLRSRDPQVRVRYLLIEGNPSWDIRRIAQELKADLIVMGTHGRTGLARLLMGSVAEQVVRKASCPVLTVKAPQRAQSDTREAVAATAGGRATAAK